MPAARANIDWTIGCRNFFCIEGIANAHIQYILLSHHERNSLCICSLLGRASSSARMFGMRRTVPRTPAGDGIPEANFSKKTMVKKRRFFVSLRLEKFKWKRCRFV
jgi:hypothetical protein